MRISTRGRYAVRLMLDLATNYTGKPIRLKDVAKRQEISDKYLEQIISILNKAGFVRSVRGPQGGYALQQTPDKYTIGMILRLKEGSLAPVECLDDNGAICEREENCVTQILWKKLDDAIKGVVDNITLEDLMNWQAVKADEYVIEKRQKNILYKKRIMDSQREESIIFFFESRKSPAGLRKAISKGWGLACIRRSRSAY